jgi:biopolymer transport protein ExbD
MAIRLSLEEDRVEETHEINVTPFIDVILVLLIIFMVAAPLSTVDVNVDLPASTAHPAPRPDKPVFLTVKADLSLALGDDPVGRESLAAALDTATKDDKEQRIFVRADRKVAYGDVMEVMNLLRTAGYLKIGLVGLEADAAAIGPPGPAPATRGAKPGEPKP